MKDSNSVNSEILNWLRDFMKKHDLIYMHQINDLDVTPSIMEQWLVTVCGVYLRNKLIPELLCKINRETDWDRLIRHRFRSFLGGNYKINIAEEAVADFDLNIVSTCVVSEELKRAVQVKREAFGKMLKQSEAQADFIRGWINPYMKDHGIVVNSHEKPTKESSLNWVVRHMNSLMAAHLNPSIVQDEFLPYPQPELIKMHRLSVVKILEESLTGVNTTTMIADFETAMGAYAAG